MLTDIDRIRDALNYVPPTDRDTWLKMGTAIKSDVGEPGFDLWDTWSQQADSYNNRDSHDVWRSMTCGSVTLGSLFHEAKARGWHDDGTRRMPTQEELAERKRVAAERAAREAAAAAQDNAAAARKAKALWKAATPAGADHPYLVRKGTPPVDTLRELPVVRAGEILGYMPQASGKLLEGRLLVAPIKVGSHLSTCELIDVSGRKSAIAGGAKRAGYWAAQPLPDDVGSSTTLLIGEGVATVLSAASATGHPAVAALSCGNLVHVAQAMRERYPQARIVILADLGNGEADAEVAARACGGFLARPDFGDDHRPEHTDFNDMAAHVGAEAVKRAIGRAAVPDASAQHPAGDDAAAPDSGGWLAPLPLTVADDVTPYPLDALPGGIGEAVREVVGFVQCPPALAACSALSALSLAGQALADVQRANGLKGPTSLYVLAVAESGERKTTCDGLFLAPIREWERDQAERAKPELAEHAARHAAWEERRAGIKGRIRQAAQKGEDSNGAECDLLSEEANCPQAPRVPRLVHADATPEALAWALAHGWPSGGVMSSEAGVVFGGHGMGRDSVMRNLSLLNALWDGASHRVERRTSESFTLAGVRLTMGLAAQPETVRQFMEGTKGLARGNGFAARFLIAAPASTQGVRLFKDAPEWRYLEAFAARLRELLTLPVRPDDAGALTLPVLTLTDAARAAWVRFHDDVEAELRPGGDMAEVRDVASKAADNVARLAALFHLYMHGVTGQIDVAVVAAAARIVGWHLYQARAFLGDVAAPRELTAARRLDAWLVDFCRREGVREVERRTIQNRGPNPVRGRAGP